MVTEIVEPTPIASISYKSPVSTAGADVARADAAMHILVVEDDPNVRNMLALLLGTRWTVSIASGGDAALAMVRSTPPDLVISDVRMPEIDGITLLKRFRDEPATRDVPVILVSGQAGEQETIAGLEAGADDFLVKPFSARELLVRVQTRLEVTAMRRRNAQQEAALESLRRHTGWTERLLDSLPVPLLLLEPGDARILFANRAAVALFGAPLHRGLPVHEIAGFRLPDEEGGGPVASRDIAPTSPERKLQGRRLIWQTKSGPVWLLADSELIPQIDEHTPVAVLTLRDVTPLIEQEEELRRTVRSRDEFLSVASHELRTPITTLGLQTESLLRGHRAEQLDETLRRKLGTIRTQIKRLEQLINALLDVSRLMAGRLELQAEDVDLRAVADEAIELLREPAEDAGCQIHVHGAAAVPGRWDRLRVGQVVTNLLSNAIKFGRGKPVEIDIALAGDRARLRVQDHGVGVSPEARERIFGRFERASSERHFPGLGLGLWITKQIVDACGGTIAVDSQPGLGATFTVELPTVR
ncbi:MAG TPA: ATP-binding protein [Polyangia bacterium]|nr:ATP-binding protein [Polyangia bacterium]